MCFGDGLILFLYVVVYCSSRLCFWDVLDTIKHSHTKIHEF